MDLMRRLAVVALLCAGLVVASAETPGHHAPAASASDITPVPAAAADSLVDSYGVGIHLAFLDTPYKDATAVAGALKDLGVRHVRDDLYMANPRQYAGIRTVANEGVRFNLIMGRPTSPQSAADYVATVAKELPASAVESIEGTNEWDISGRDAWVEEMHTRQKQLYAAAKANPATKHLPVLAPALAFRWNYAAAGDMSTTADLANGHLYPGGWQPTEPMAKSTNAIRSSSGSQQLIVTEAGYNNAVNTTNGHLPVPEDVSGVYQPRLLLDHVLRGTKRVYSYELIDEFNDPDRTNVEAHFGLLRRDLTPKPAYTAMKNLLGLVADPGASFTPGSLAYRLEGAGSDVRQLLVQKRNGQFVLLLWRDVAVYDPTKKQRLTVTPTPVTLNLASAAVIHTYKPTQGAQATTVGTAGSVSLSLDGQVQAVTISPVDQDPSPTPTPTLSPGPSPTEVPVAAPSTVRTAPGDRSATVTWEAPATETGATGFQVVRQPGNVVRSVPASAGSLRFTGLVNARRYTFSVRTVAARGVSAWPPAATAIPATVPTRPRISKATAARHGSVVLSWRASAGQGRAITGYQVLSGRRSVVVGASSLRAALRGLPKRVKVRVGVRAKNAVGWSAVTWSPVVRTRR
jgi:hypothetical protein